MALELDLRQAQRVVELKEATPSILVIDPDSAFCIVVGIMLKLKNYSVRRAHTPAAALSILELIRPDLIVINRALLASSASELVGYLKSRRDHENIPLIGIQPGHNSPTPLESDGLLADAHLNRPFTANELHDLIARLL